MGVAVELPGDLVAHLPVHLGGHDAHGGHRRAERREEVGDGVGLLEVEESIPFPGGLLGREAQIQQHRVRLPAHALVGGRELQMQALVRVGDAAAGQKSAADKGLHAALVLQHAEIDVVRERGVRVGAEDVEDPGELCAVEDHEALFPGLALLRETVEVQREGPAEELRQTRGKSVARGNDARFACGKAAAV